MPRYGIALFWLVAPTSLQSLVCVVSHRNGEPGTRVRIVRIVRLHFQPGLLSSVGSIAEATTCQTDGNAHSESHLGGSHPSGNPILPSWGKSLVTTKSKAKKKNGGLSCNSRHRSNGSRGWRNLEKPSPDLYHVVSRPLRASRLLSDHRK